MLDNFSGGVVNIVGWFFYYYWGLFEYIMYYCCNVWNNYDGEDYVCCEDIDIKCGVRE